MTKKTLQGIAVGILLTTLLFAYQFYFTDTFIVVKEITIEPNENEFDDQLKQHLETNKLVLIDKEDYDLFLQSKTKGNTEEKVEVAKPQPVVEKVVIKAGLAAAFVKAGIETTGGDHHNSSDNMKSSGSTTTLNSQGATTNESTSNTTKKLTFTMPIFITPSDNTRVATPTVPSKLKIDEKN